MLQSWRIYLFTGNKIFIGFLLTASAAACGTGIARFNRGVDLIRVRTYLPNSAQLPGLMPCQFPSQAKLISVRPIVEVNLALQCAVDVIIAGEVYPFLKA
jgi:hypothetical protein